jgi:hypothetical protein
MSAAKLKRALVGAVALLLAGSPVWAAPDKPSPKPRPPPGISKKAPEIDASSGAAAIALLSGVVLLLRERSKRRDP